MGLLLDTCVLIDAERKKLKLETILESLSSFGKMKFAISAMTVMELAHGVARAQTERVRQSRSEFLQAVRMTLPIVPVSEEVALQAGELDGVLRGHGFVIGIADAIIAASALQRGESVATYNAKHFQIVPGLEVFEL